MRCNFRLSLAVLAMGTSSIAAESISDELAKLKGQPVGNVTARLGNPESQQWGQSGATYLLDLFRKGTACADHKEPN
jgi:hypothetical protein